MCVAVVCKITLLGYVFCMARVTAAKIFSYVKKVNAAVSTCSVRGVTVRVRVRIGVKMVNVDFSTCRVRVRGRGSGLGSRSGSGLGSGWV
jgi:hypothetical protein